MSIYAVEGEINLTLNAPLEKLTIEVGLEMIFEA
jgi:hypothetical protein